ncbi:MAG: vitamin K epoxide reductase family protein [Candidatus Caldarchaeum sp.]|uniref:Vitamin K epoxide reductase family protein n=1 Tax=Caldiarchaeum subterraneum TaxID=311458 RepID=A0A7C5Y4S6_CALS0
MKIFYIASALSIVGLVLSMYLTLLPAPQFCEISSFISCDKVLSSPYAYFLGVPTAFYGVVWFALASSALFLAGERKKAAKFMTFWSFVGLAAVAVLVYVEIVLIDALCLLCTGAHVLVVAVSGLVFYAVKNR